MKNISREVIFAMPIALPPVRSNAASCEVEQLMKVCDDLEAAHPAEERVSRWSRPSSRSWSRSHGRGIEREGRVRIDDAHDRPRLSAFSPIRRR